MFTYEQAKEFVIQHLVEDADHHDFGRFFRIGEHYDKLDANLPRGAGTQFDKLHVALIFWDSWQDARNHDWQYYPKIKPSQWPTLARSIVADILTDREIQDELILELFGKRK